MSNQERTIRVTLVKSPIGYTQDQRRTVKALGLNKMHVSRVHKETPQIRGMVNKVIHLLQVEEVDE
jgi:large subunit ribosomal protein L30